MAMYSGLVVRLSLALMVVSASGLVLSSTPSLPTDFLEDFYAAMNGDDWHRNDGWLDPEVDVCDWYGITCRTEIGQDDESFEWIGYIRLRNNNLQGELSGALISQLYFSNDIGLPSVELDLSGNAISGQLSVLPVGIPRLILANNRLEGPLPPPPGLSQPPGTSPPPRPIHLVYLDLSGNAFTGMVNPLWQDWLALDFLDLSDNQLEGSIESAVKAMRETPAPGHQVLNSGLWLADNGFSGEIDPEWFEDRELASINLCWNAIQINDPALDAWIAERHWGGSHHQCLDRERLALDPTVSGTWYDIHRSGEGLSLLLLDDGTPLVFWFSHISDNRQLWLFNSGRNRTTTAEISPLLRTRGEFGQGFGTLDNPLFGGGGLRLDRVGPERLHAEFRVGYTGYDLTQPGDVAITWPPIPATGFRSDHYQLTRLAGSTCDNQHAMQWTSGAWYNHERDGEGFVVEVNEDGRGIVYWFTYTPEGTNDDSVFALSGDWHAWMTGEGHFEGNSLIIDNLLQARDTASAMPADASGIENQHWGSLRLDFHDDLSGQISYDSVLEDFGSGSYPIERLARPRLADCE